MATILKESVVRNLTKTIAAVSIFAPATAFPLGIGDIKLHSALNQKLDAEIALILAANESASDIKVRLAPPEKFDEAGVPWSYFLSKIKFNSVVRADGSTIIKLSSNETLREPFLDFLLEVSWKNGSLYREFTVLVDPPVAYTQPVIPVVKKAETVDAVVSKPVSEVNQKQAVVSKIVVDPVNASAEYGPTRRSDSLWKVAKRTNAYNDVSIEQMMVAIYKANPKSFYKDNVNALMAGQTLDIPDREAILKMSHKQALAEYRRHDNIWKGRVVAKVKKNKSAVEIAKTKAEELNTQLELEAPVEAEIIETAVVIGEDAAISHQITPKIEEGKDGLASSSDAGLALQARMEKLEQQLVMMQKMLSLKDEQLAALQSKVKTIKAPNAQTLADQNAVTAKKEEQIQPKKLVAESKSAVQAKPVKPKAVTKPKPKLKSKPVIQPKPEEGFFSNSLYLALAGIGVAIMAILGLFLWRKQQDETETDTESMFATASEISLPDSEAEDFITPPADEENASYDVGTVGESSFLSEFTPSDFDAFDTDQNEVDPISEADVYLAYGRYQQAEDLMRQAIEDQPERDECKLKLLEIFYANENKSSFTEFATELVNSGKNNDQEFWAKVVEMGVEIDPESALYTDNAGGEQGAFQTEQILTPENNESTELAEESGEGKAEFDLSAFDQEAADSDLELKSGAENSDGLDFDLSVFDLDGGAATQIEDVEESTDEIESVDFDLSPTDTDETKLVEESIESENEEIPADEIESLEFDLTTDSSTSEDNDESIDLNTEGDPEELSISLESDEQAVSEGTSSIEDFDFDFDPPDTANEASDTVDEAPDTGSTSEVSDLTDMDELETKIDLAKAYIDMGDADAAKGIVKEVLEKGSEEQKVAAQAVIDQLE